jgi:hypothetical protein
MGDDDHIGDVGKLQESVAGGVVFLDGEGLVVYETVICR